MKHTKLLLSLVCFFSSSSLLSASRFSADERKAALERRLRSARLQTVKKSSYDVTEYNNGDELLFSDYAAQFTKTLEHDATTGVPTTGGQASYEQMVKAIQSGKQSDYNAIVRASAATRLLVNPQAGAAYSMQGCDSSLLKMPIPPMLSSAEAATEMLEAYLKAYCRDVKFNEYGTGSGTDANGSGGSRTDDAAKVLQALSSTFAGPHNGSSVVDASVLFRGPEAGCLVGPYISQFMFISVRPFSQELVERKQHIAIAQSREFGVTWSDFVSIQDGAVPVPYAASDFDQVNTRYPISARDIATFVHGDTPYEAYYNALNILGNYGCPLVQTLPYANGSITNEDAFATMGAPDAYNLIGGVSIEALKAAWCQKWRCHRRLRPEAMAGLVHRKKVTASNPYNLHSSLFAVHDGVDVLALTLARNSTQAGSSNTYLLGLMYPEGSPTHPSYPAGHAVLAGACTTVIKAIFEDRTLINTLFSPVKPNPADSTALVALSGEDEGIMTVGGELDKLASNIALARNFAGVHYRSDGDDGILLGEEVAIRYLQDQARTYVEQGFGGYELTKRDGTRIRITADTVTVIG